MKHLLILIIIFLGLWAFASQLSGQEELTGILNIDFEEETAMYSEVYEFEMTASVEPNFCNTCLRYFRPTQCLEACEQVVIYD